MLRISIQFTAFNSKMMVWLCCYSLALLLALSHELRRQFFECFKVLRTLVFKDSQPLKVTYTHTSEMKLMGCGGGAGGHFACP